MSMGRGRHIATFDGWSVSPIPDMRRVVSVRYYPDWQEYVCRVTDDGKRREGMDYYTSDRQDALDTAVLIAKGE